MVINATGINAAGTEAASNQVLGHQGVSGDDFLTLLIAQLTHQDPLSPMEPDQFMAQLAQLETVSELGEIRHYLQAAGELSNPLSALGRTVYWNDSSGQSYSGKASAVARDDTGGFKLVVGGRQIDFSQINRIE